LFFVFEISQGGGDGLSGKYLEPSLDFLGVDEERLEGAVRKAPGGVVGRGPLH